MKQNFRFLAFVLAFFGLLALSAGVAYGQNIDGNIVGAVVDSQGAVVVGAAVSIANTATGDVRNTTTNSTGEYRFDHLPTGNYRITAKMTGFKTVSEQAEVLLNKTGTRNLTLSPGSTSETIEVSGAPPAIDTTTAQLGSNYDSLYSQQMGVTSAGANGAGVLNLSLLSPGASNASGMGLGTGPSVGGQRPRDNNFTIEGVDNNNKTVTGSLVTIPPDAVDSFTLLSNQFNSEFGHSSGGQFNTTVKSGTNTFHGSVYEYFRNRDLNAVDNYAVLQGLTKNPRFDSNRYGATFGGPIIKNKLFFFTNFERQPIGTTSFAGATVQAPTTAGLAAIATDPNLSATNFGIFKQYVPLPAAGTSPPSCIPFNGTFGGSTFSAPANGACAAGSIEAGNVSIVPPSWSNYENFVQSLDYNISSSDQLRARFVYNKLDQIDNNAQLPAFFVTLPVRYDLLNVSEFHTFSAHVTNEFRTGFNRFDQTYVVGSQKYPGLDAFPNITLNDLGGGLNIGPDSNAPQFTIQNFYQFVDNVSWLKGRHNLKFGAEYRWYISPQQFTQRSRGDYEWNETQLFLEDYSPDYLGERSSGSSTYYGNQKAIYWFVNDTVKATSNLNFSVGLRYEYTTTATGIDRQSLNAISNTPSVIVPGFGPLLFNAPAAPKKNFAPRVGVVYSPGTSGNTSIRAGWGMAYDTLYDNIGILAVPPQIGATNDVDPTTITPGFLAGGGLSGGGSGLSVYDRPTAISLTSSWLPSQIKDPYSINWNLGIQHSFAKNYTAEVNYVGTHGVHLSFQDRLNKQALVTPTAFLPTYTTAPTQVALDALPLTLTALKAPGNIPAQFLDVAGPGCSTTTPCSFGSSLTAYLPLGASIYHGLQTSLTRRFSNGLTFQAAYTWSRTIDNGTADFFTSYLTPRRPQDFLNVANDRSVSALSRTHRLTIAAVYSLPFFKSGNWFQKNLIGNWEFSPVYTYESPEWVDPQAGVDANLNGDSAGDRVIINPQGVGGTGTAVNALKNTAGATVAYCACGAGTNPNAYYIQAGPGALATSGRNILASPHTNNFDLAGHKDFNITERAKFQFGAQIANIFNHPQLIPGSNPGSGLGVNDVASFTTATSSYLSYVKPSDPNFNKPYTVFASNARTIALVAKFVF
jgi:hypothetical protein